MTLQINRLSFVLLNLENAEREKIIKIGISQELKEFSR